MYAERNRPNAINVGSTRRRSIIVTVEERKEVEGVLAIREGDCESPVYVEEGSKGLKCNIWTSGREVDN